jgi:hypothetical protein
MPEHYRDTAVCFLTEFNATSGEIVKPGGVGRFHRRLVFNIDQMALPFSFSTGRTYARRGACIMFDFVNGQYGDKMHKQKKR